LDLRKRKCWRRLQKLHNEELHKLYASKNIMKVIKPRKLRWARHVVRMGEMKLSYYTAIGSPEWMSLLGTPRSRRENNFRMEFRKRGWEVVDWIHLAQDRNQWWAVVITAVNLRVP
jgi:hypothetical protein